MQNFIRNHKLLLSDLDLAHPLVLVPVIRVLTLPKLHVGVLTSSIKSIKFLQNLMKLFPNHVMV